MSIKLPPLDLTTTSCTALATTSQEVAIEPQVTNEQSPKRAPAKHFVSVSEISIDPDRGRGFNEWDGVYSSRSPETVGVRLNFTASSLEAFEILLTAMSKIDGLDFEDQGALPFLRKGR